MKITICLFFIYLSTVFCYPSVDSEHQRHDVVAYKRIPAIRRIVHGQDEHDDSEHRATELNNKKTLHHEDDTDSHDKSSLPEDNESDHIDGIEDYQLEEYPSVPIRPPSAPTPVVFFGPKGSVDRRQIRVPVVRTPSYSRLYEVAAPIPVSYRTINPLTYSVPSRVRNVVLGYPSLPNPAVRYTYSAPSSGLDNGLLPLEYRGYITEEYDDFLKKK